MIIEITPQDAGRIMSALRDRHRKLSKGVAKFGDDFDMELGRNMLEGRNEYKALINKLQEQIK